MLLVLLKLEDEDEDAAPAPAAALLLSLLLPVVAGRRKSETSGSAVRARLSYARPVSSCKRRGEKTISQGRKKGNQRENGT